MQIIVVFPKRENAVNIRNILVRGGAEVIGVATTGAQVLQCVDHMEKGIVVTGYQLSDMGYGELRGYLPEVFEMLLIASPDKWKSGLAEGTMGLATPLKAGELLNTVEMMMVGMEQRRRKRKETLKNRDADQQKIILQAKELLMSRNQMTEPEAHRYLQKSSMNNGTSMTETAQMVLSVMQF